MMKPCRICVSAVFAACLMLQNVNADVADGYLVRWIQRRAEKLNHEVSNRPFESVRWAADIREAIILAEEHERPIFLFTLDGHFTSGRC